jgi:hypothetical protein
LRRPREPTSGGSVEVGPSTEWFCELGNQLDLSLSLVNHVMLGALPPDEKQPALTLVADLRAKLETLSAHIEAM